jgi:hypothetical protein
MAAPSGSSLFAPGPTTIPGETGSLMRRSGLQEDGVDGRDTQIEALRDAYAAGKLDLTVPIDHPGLDLLLEELALGVRRSVRAEARAAAKATS